MKNIQVLITIVCLSLNQLRAQPELLSSEMPPIGTNMIYHNFANQIDTAIQGSGSVWNFSVMTPDIFYPDQHYSVVDPLTNPFISQFPGTNYCIENTTWGLNNFYTYYSLTNSLFERLGSYEDTLNVCSNSQIELVFPLSMGSYNSDSMNCLLFPHRNYYSFYAVGFGTLILPSGSFNAIMIRINSNDRLGNETTYKWFDSDNGLTLLTYTLYDPYVSGNINSYLHSSTIGVEQITNLYELNYQNPIENNFTLNYRSKTTLRFLFHLNNILGQEVFYAEDEVSADKKETLNIDFSPFASGIYFLNIRSGKTGEIFKTLKLVKP